jgi:hypothetical protein
LLDLPQIPKISRTALLATINLRLSDAEDFSISENGKYLVKPNQRKRRVGIRGRGEKVVFGGGRKVVG